MSSKLNIDQLRDNWVEKKLEDLEDRSQEALRKVLRDAFMAGYDTAVSLNEDN